MQIARILKSSSNADVGPANPTSGPAQARAIAISGSRDLQDTVVPDFEQDWAGQGYGNQPQAPSVTVNNNGQYYRPWREELGISFGRTLGNFFAFPIRLVGNILQGLLGIGMSIVKLIVLAVVAPTLIFTGIQMYQAKQNGESSTEIAAEVAGDAIGLAGAAIGGIWDAIFDSDEDG